jgi:hypothetical protein
MSQKRKTEAAFDVAFCGWQLSLSTELAKVIADVAWIKRILFLILALAIGNLFISFSGP